MNEFKELCERVLEIPAPARPTSGEILALARRSARARRARLRLLLSSLIVGLAGAGVLWTVRPTPPAVEQVQRAQMPPPEAVASHANQAADAVDRAVPVPLLSPSWTMITEDEGRWALRLLFSSEGSEGTLMVYYQHTGLPSMPVDLCAPEVGAEIIGLHWAAIDLCYELTIDDQQIRVAVGPEIVAATRFLRDGSVTAVARRGSAALLTPRQVAQVVADPELLPAPRATPTRPAR